MKALIQRVLEARVCVEKRVVGEIGNGALVFFGVGQNDDLGKIELLAKKILNLRIFGDKSDKMNLSVRDVEGGILVVPQFTLYADTRKGNRPSFGEAAEPEAAREMYEKIVGTLETLYPGHVQQGQFGADMKVSLVNDGPVTIMLEV